jgi:DNA-binding transcriptional regulator YhcF (GntR family)
MEFESNTPIYLQLIDFIKLQIVSGKLQPGEKLPSVRDLAMTYGVNPNTMQKALSELEWEKLVYTVRTTGRYVTEDAALIQALRKELAEMKIGEFFTELRKLGYSKEEIRQLLESYMEGMMEDGSIG